MEQEQDNQYNGPKIIKENKEKDYTSHLKEIEKSDRVGPSEAATIKIMYNSGMNKSRISKTMQRGPNTVSNIIDNFENYLPENESLKEKIETQMDQITDTLMGRAMAIIDKADEGVYQRIDNKNVSPLDQSKISERYMDRLANLIGESKLKSKKAKETDRDDSKIDSILNMVLNVNINKNQDDRPKESSTIIEEDRGSSEGGEEGSNEKSS